jgi:hypothetical protein
MSAVPMGLRGNCSYASPALKRGANNRCAYGASDQATVEIVRYYPGPLKHQ